MDIPKIALFTVLSALLSSNSFATNMWITVFPTQTYADGLYHGQCGINTDTPVLGLNCLTTKAGSTKLTFDCSGKMREKSVGANMLSSAQLALVLDTNLALYVSDTQTIDGACLVKSLVVRKPT